MTEETVSYLIVWKNLRRLGVNSFRLVEFTMKILDAGCSVTGWVQFFDSYSISSLLELFRFCISS